MSDESSDLAMTDGEPSSEELAGAEAALAEARRRLLSVPADVVITNHAMGLYELAAIHLSASEPDLGAASLAIDALAALVDGLGERLGPETPTLREALSTIQMAYVQMRAGAGAGAAPDA